MITTAIKLKPIAVPNFILVAEAKGDRPSFPIHELEDATIEELIEQFGIDVLSKVKKDRHAKANR